MAQIACFSCNKLLDSTQNKKQMTQLKGLIPQIVMDTDSFHGLINHGDEYRKVTQGSLDFIEMIIKVVQREQKNNEILFSELTEFKHATCPSLYRQLKNMFEALNEQSKVLSQKLRLCYDDVNALCKNLFLDLSNNVVHLQKYVNNYSAMEQIVKELAKKYFKSLRHMMLKMQDYKVCLVDAKLIYNVKEKIKRYEICEKQYENILQEHEAIDEKLVKLTKQKQSIIKLYSSIQDQIMRLIKVLGTKFIVQSKNSLTFYCLRVKNCTNLLLGFKENLSKQNLEPIFACTDKIMNPNLFDCNMVEKKQYFVPSIIYYYQNLKYQHVVSYTRNLTEVVKELQRKTDDKMYFNKKMHEYLEGYFKNLQKTTVSSIKEALEHYQKIVEKLRKCYGSKLCVFVGSLCVAHQFYIMVSQKNCKRIRGHINQLQQIFQEQNNKNTKFIYSLKNQTAVLTDKLIKINSDINLKKQKQIEKMRSIMANKMPSIYEECVKFGNQSYNIISKVKEKILLIHEDLKLMFQQLNELLRQNFSDFYSRDFMRMYHEFQQQVELLKTKQSEFFRQSTLGILFKDQSQITFLSERNKFQDFKKLKRPINPDQQTHPDNQSRLSKLSIEQSSKKKAELVQLNKPVLQKFSNDSQKLKYMQFLAGRVEFAPDEVFIESYSCAIADKIILHGRIYLTSERLCFHSKFNPSTVFFGGSTFINIPKKDIKKVEKRVNAIFFDNSILVSTIHGQIFLTSFFTRDLALKAMQQAFEINMEDMYLENSPDNVEDLNKLLQIQTAKEDDLAQGQEIDRNKKIQVLLNHQFQYKEMFKEEVQNVDAYNMFKLFYSGQQLSINKRQQLPFLVHIKTLMGHTNIDMPLWSPDVFQYLNPLNFKKECPLQFTRKNVCDVPVKNPGIPFMPKTAKSEEFQTLFIVSKNKWFIEAKLLTSGAPLADTFQLRLLRKFETVNQKNCLMTVEGKVHFVKSTMMQSVIEGKTEEDVAGFMVKTVSQIKKFMKNLQLKKQQALGNSSSQKIIQDKNEIFQQVQQLKQKNEALSKNLQEKKTLTDKYKYGLIASVILNILLFLLWISL